MKLRSRSERRTSEKAKAMAKIEDDVEESDGASSEEDANDWGVVGGKRGRGSGGGGKRRRKSGFVSVMAPGIRRRLKMFEGVMDEEEDSGESGGDDDEEEEVGDVEISDRWLKSGDEEGVAKLKGLFGMLKGVENGDAGEYERFSEMCRVLVGRRFLKSGFRRRRLWTCCCLVEVLRISAPEPPFGDEVLKLIFETCTRLLAGLRFVDHKDFVTLFGLLEQLATIKAYALIANEVHASEDVFLAFYGTIVEKHSIKLQSYLGDILSSLLEEAESIPPSLLSILLSPLTHPASYKDPEAARTLASIVIATSQNALTTPLSNLLNASLAGETKKQGQDTIDCDLSSLLVRLNRIAPDLLIHVIPNLEADARHDSVSHRLRCVTILSQLFSSSKRMVSAYPTLYSEYLDRCIDVDPNIRACVTATLGTLLKYAAQDAPTPDDIRRQYLCKRLRERLLDTDERVRATAVSAAGQAFRFMEPELREAFTSRLKDKKSRVRCSTLDAMIGARDADEEEWIPYIMIQSYPTLRRIGDIKATEMIEKAIFHDFIPWNEDSSSRITEFVRIAGACDKHALQTLIGLLRRNSTTRIRLMTLVEARLNSTNRNKSEGGDAGRFEVEHAAATFGKRSSTAATNQNLVKPSSFKSFGDLVGVLPQHHEFRKEDTPETLTKALINVVDLKILKSLKTSFGLDSSVEDIRNAQADVIARLASQQSVQKFVEKILFLRAAPSVFTNEHIVSLMSMLKPSSELMDLTKDTQETDHMQSARLTLLDVLSVAMIDGLKIVEDQIIEMVTMGDSIPVQKTGLKVLSRMGAHSLPVELKRELCICMTGTNSVSEDNAALNSKWATRVLAKIYRCGKDIVPQETWNDITMDLSEKLDNFKGDLSTIVAPLHSLAQLAKFAPKIFKKVSLQSFDFARSLLSGSWNSQIETHRASVVRKTSPAKRTRRKRSRSLSDEESESVSLDKAAAESIKAATKVLVNALPYVDAADELPSTLSTLTKILKSGGDVYDRYSDDDEGREKRCDDVTCGLMRLAASLAILRLARNPAYFQKLPPSTFLICLLTAQDPLADIRLSFVSKIHSMILRKHLPFRWVTGLALMAVDPDRDNLNAVRELMTSLIRRRRYLIRNWTKNTQITNMLPEAELPVLLWVIANHPDAVDDAANGYDESSKYIEFFLDRLLDQHDYAGVLSQKLQAVSMASDAVSQSPGSAERLVALSRLGGSILQKKQAGRKWNLDKIPGDISLPGDLFRSSVHLNNNSKDLLAVARNFDARQEDTSTLVTRTPKSMRVRDTKPSLTVTPRTPAVKTPKRSFAASTPKSKGSRCSLGKRPRKPSRSLNAELDVEVSSTGGSKNKDRDDALRDNIDAEKENFSPPKRRRGAKGGARKKKQTVAKTKETEKPRPALRRSTRNRKS